MSRNIVSCICLRFVWIEVADNGRLGLEYYWVSLREGAKAAKPRWEETLREEIRPRVSNLATWYLGEYHQAKDVASEKHADAYPAEESVLVDKDRRLRVYPHQFKEGASYRGKTSKNLLSEATL